MAYEAKWAKSVLFVFITVLLLSSGTSESKPAWSNDGEVKIPMDVACAFRGEDFYYFLVESIAAGSEGGVKQENLEALKTKILASPMMVGDPSWRELADAIIFAHSIKSGTSKMILERSIPGIFDINQSGGRVKKGIEEEVKSKDPVELKFARLSVLDMAMDGRVHKIDVCGMESQILEYEGGTLLLNLNDFRTRYHGLWLADLYIWFRNQYPNLDQQLFDDAKQWRAPMPVFIEGATGDKPEDGSNKREIYAMTNVERLGRITSEFKRKSVQWFEIDWSKSVVDIEGRMSHPSIIDEHKNFTAQFMGAVELVHLMETAVREGKQLQVMAFSAGSNVIAMAAEIYKGLGKKGSPFRNVILVQGSISYERNLSPIIDLMSTGSRIIITRNRDDSFYLGAGTRSIGYAGGMELFGKGDSVGYFGVEGRVDRKVEVWDIYKESDGERRRKPLLNSAFRGSKVTDSAEGEHWNWFTPHNFRRLIKLFYF